MKLTWMATVFALLATTLANVELILKIVLLAVTITFTLWKWVKESRKKQACETCDFRIKVTNLCK